MKQTPHRINAVNAACAVLLAYGNHSHSCLPNCKTGSGDLQAHVATTSHSSQCHCASCHTPDLIACKPKTDALDAHCNVKLFRSDISAAHAVMSLPLSSCPHAQQPSATISAHTPAYADGVVRSACGLLRVVLEGESDAEMRGALALAVCPAVEIVWAQLERDPRDAAPIPLGAALLHDEGASVFVGVGICMYVCVYMGVCVCVFVCVCVCVCVCVYVYIYTYFCIYIYIYIYIYTYIYINIYLYVDIYVFVHI